MALVVNRRLEQEPSSCVLSLAFDSSYPTGGYDLDLRLYGFTTIHAVQLESTGGYQAVYDRDNRKLKLLNAGSEVANTTDLSAITDARLVVRGRR